MAMVFKFRMLSDENDNFVRDFEVPYDMNLLDLHDFICGQLNYDKKDLTSFFASDAYWERLQEFTLKDLCSDSDEGPLPMESVTLGQIMRKNNDRIIFVFDMLNDRALYLELVATLKAEKNVTYPRVTFAESDAPDQYEPSNNSAGNSIFDEALGDFSDFEGDDFYDDEY